MFLANIFWANCSFAYFLWATWANCSGSLICLERPERFAHSGSFPLSDLSNSLKVAHLSWAIWANRSRRSFDLSEMSGWANEWIPSTVEKWDPHQNVLDPPHWSLVWHCGSPIHVMEVPKNSLRIVFLSHFRWSLKFESFETFVTSLLKLKYFFLLTVF